MKKPPLIAERIMFYLVEKNEREFILGDLKEFYNETLKASATDWCDKQNKSNLRELYCDDNDKIATKTYDCPSGCKDGACIYPWCEDTDKGKDYSEKGSVSKAGSNFTDFCIGNELYM